MKTILIAMLMVVASGCVRDERVVRTDKARILGTAETAIKGRPDVTYPFDQLELNSVVVFSSAGEKVESITVVYTVPTTEQTVAVDSNGVPTHVSVVGVRVSLDMTGRVCGVIQNRETFPAALMQRYKHVRFGKTNDANKASEATSGSAPSAAPSSPQG